MAVRKTAVDPRQAALEALAPSLAEVDPKILFGSKTAPGFFAGSSQGVKSMAELCVKEGWLEDTGSKVGTGRNTKNLYALTPKGRKAILDSNPTKKLLETLDQSARSQLGELQGISLTLRALTSRLESFDGAVQDVLQKVRNPVHQTNGSLNGHVPLPDVETELISSVHARGVHKPTTLPELFNALHARWPTLSLGEFHDCVRRLWKQGRIKLDPYTRPFGEIAHQYEALFLDAQVMYYVFAA